MLWSFSWQKASLSSNFFRNLARAVLRFRAAICNAALRHFLGAICDFVWFHVSNFVKGGFVPTDLWRMYSWWLQPTFSWWIILWGQLFIVFSESVGFIMAWKTVSWLFFFKLIDSLIFMRVRADWAFHERLFREINIFLWLVIFSYTSCILLKGKFLYFMSKCM